MMSTHTPTATATATTTEPPAGIEDADRAGAPRRDHGAVLPLVLILTIVFGVLVVSISTYVATALRSTNVTTDRVNRLADAESGMRAALVAITNTGTCPSGELAIASNGSTATVEGCESVAVGGSDTTRTFGLVMTGLHGQSQIALDGKNNSKEPVEIGGDVFLGPNVSATTSIDELIALDDVIVQRDSCSDYEPVAMSWLGAFPNGDDTQPPVGARPICREWTWLDVSPPPTGFEIPTTPRGSSAASTGSNVCNVFEPGVYNNLNVSNNRSVYLKSGVYVISGSVSIGNGATITAGHPGEVTILAGDDNGICRGVQQADVDDPTGGGAGVVFVLVGNGHFAFGNNSHTEIFGYPVGDRTMSVIAFPDDARGVVPAALVPGEFAGNSNRSARSTTQNLMSGNPNGFVVFRGEFWAPASWADLHVPSSGRAGAGFLGGLTVARTNYHLTGQAIGGLLFMMDTEPSRFRYRVVVTATDDRGGTTSVSAVVLGDEDGVTLESWRVF